MRTNESLLFVAVMVLVLTVSACGGATAAKGTTDASVDHQVAPADGQPLSACTTLVWLFGGCTTAALDECAREFATFPSAMQNDIASYAACLRTMAMGLPDAAVIAGTDASCPTSGNALNRWYQHGGCEGDAAQVSHDIGAFDPCTGTAVSCTTLTSETDCNNRYGVCTWSGAVCSDFSTAPPTCSGSAGQCALVPGCLGTGFPTCGATGQPVCFFSQMLPGSVF